MSVRTSEAPVSRRPPGRAIGRLRAAIGLLAAAAGLVALPAPTEAQSDADFLFERPAVHLDILGGYALPSAESQIFDFTRERLTVEDSDLRSVAAAGALGWRVTERLDLALEVGYSRAETTSEFRDFVDPDGRPIEQTTRFTRVPVTVTVRAYLWERGRSVGRFAWVPRTWSPYVGAGGGWMGYDFSQEGEFVDFQTLEIFDGRFHSDGGTGTAHVLAGTEVSLAPRFAVTGEARYSWASAGMSREFQGFDEIDLSGFQATLGLTIRL